MYCAARRSAGRASAKLRLVTVSQGRNCAFTVSWRAKQQGQNCVAADRASTETAQHGPRPKSGVRSNGQPAQTRNQDKREPRTNGTPSSLPSPSNFLRRATDQTAVRPNGESEQTTSQAKRGTRTKASSSFVGEY
jgi:hypothetical protein